MSDSAAPFNPAEHTLSLSQAREILDKQGAEALSKRVLARAKADEDHAVLALSDTLDTSAKGPFAGIPFAVKDNIDCLPFPTTGGSPALLDYHPNADAPPVAKLKAAGAHAPMKVSLHELAFGVTNNNAHFGAVPTPFDRSRVAGGSSGGSASAVARGIIPFALGTDTGGSTRIPAAFCGVVGFRPSTGRYQDGGVLTLSTTRDTIGPMASNVTDIAEVDAMICDTAKPLATIDRPLRIGLMYQNAGLSGAVDARFQNAVENLSSAGLAEFVEIDQAPFADLETRLGSIIVAYEAFNVWTKFCAEKRQQTFSDFTEALGSPPVKAIFGMLPERGSGEAARAAYEEALVRLKELRRSYEDMFATHDLDLIAMPTVAVQPPHIGQDETIETDLGPRPTFPTIVRNASLASLTGSPSLSLPAGTDQDGLPVGFMVETRRNADRFLLAAAMKLEATLQAP